MILYSSSRINRCKNDIICADMMHTQLWRIFHSSCYGISVFFSLLLNPHHKTVFMTSCCFHVFFFDMSKCLHSTFSVGLRYKLLKYKLCGYVILVSVIKNHCAAKTVKMHVDKLWYKTLPDVCWVSHWHIPVLSDLYISSGVLSVLTWAHERHMLPKPVLQWV